MRISLFLRGAIAVEARRRRDASASIIYILVNAKHCGASLSIDIRVSIYGLRKRHMILIHAHSYVTAADGPVCHLQFHWPLCFCYKHADS